MKCLRCNHPVPEASDDCVEVICGRCVQTLVLIEEYREHAYASEYTPERVRLARKGRSLTQEDLAYKINIPKLTVSRVEQGKLDCPPELQRWVDENEH